MSESEELDWLRKRIDKIDEYLIKKIKERLSLMPQIAKAKKTKNMQVSQPEREKQVLEERKKIAKELGVSEKLVEKIFKELIEEGRRIQEKDFL